MLGNVIVLTALAVVVVLAIRSVWKSHKEGGHCSGNCGSCGCCHGKCLHQKNAESAE